MKVKRIEHVAIAVKSMAQSRKIFEEKLGFKLEYEEYLPQYSTRLAMYRIGSTYIECSNPIATTLKPRVGLPNAARACFTSASKSRELKKPSRSSEKGVKLLDERPRIGHANSRIAFIDPESTGNVLIELVELPNPS